MATASMGGGGGQENSAPCIQRVVELLAPALREEVAAAMTAVQKALRDDAKVLQKLGTDTGRLSRDVERALKRCRCDEWEEEKRALQRTVEDLRTQQEEVRGALTLADARIGALTTEVEKERKAHAFTKRMLAAAVKRPLSARSDS